METETPQELTTAINSAKVDDDKKQQLQLTVYENDMTLQTAFNKDTSIYLPVNKRLTIYWLHLWINYVLFTLFRTQTGLIIIYYISELIFNVTLIIIAFIRMKRGKSDNNKSTFNQELNAILGVNKKDERNIYNLDQISGKYVGLLFIGFSINMCLIMIVDRLYFMDDPWLYNNNFGWNGWLIFAGTNIMVYTSMGCMLVVWCLQFYSINDDVVIQMLRYKDEKILKIKNNKIGQTLNETIYEKALKKWQNQLLLKNRSMFDIFFAVYLL